MRSGLPWTMSASLFITITRHVGEYHLGAGNVPTVSLHSARLAEARPAGRRGGKEGGGAARLVRGNIRPALGVSADPANGSGGLGGVGRGSFDWLDLENIEFVDRRKSDP